MESLAQNVEDNETVSLKEQIEELDILLLALNQTHHSDTLRHLWTTLCDYQNKLAEKDFKINQLNKDVQQMSKIIAIYKHKINDNDQGDETLNDNDATALEFPNGICSKEKQITETSFVSMLRHEKIKNKNKKHRKQKCSRVNSDSAVIDDEVIGERVEKVRSAKSETTELQDLGVSVKSERIDLDDDVFDASQQYSDVAQSMLQSSQTLDDVGSLLCTVLDEANSATVKYSKPFGCHICTKTFMRMHHLNTHLRVHTGERPFTCDICKKSFTQKGSLSKHIQIHTGERPYRCEVCTKSFKQLGHLQAHYLYHTGERSHTCVQCNKSFVRKHHLERHSLTHTGVREYDCNVCNRSFNQAETRNRHIEHVHSKNSHKSRKIKTKKISIY